MTLCYFQLMSTVNLVILKYFGKRTLITTERPGTISSTWTEQNSYRGCLVFSRIMLAHSIQRNSAQFTLG